MAQIGIPGLALVISCMTYIHSIRALKGKASNNHVDSIEQQLRSEIDRCEETLKICYQERDILQRENIALMRDIIKRAHNETP